MQQIDLSAFGKSIASSTGRLFGEDPGTGVCPVDGNLIPSFRGPTVKQGVHFPSGQSWFRPKKCDACRARGRAKEERYMARSAIGDESPQTDKYGKHRNITLMHLDAVTNQLVTPTFEGFKETSSQTTAYEHLFRFAEGELRAGAYLHGGPGAGKTFLVKMLNNALIEKKRQVAYFEDNELITLMRGTQKRNAEVSIDTLMYDLTHVEVLIIDDYDPRPGRANSPGVVEDDVDFKLSKYFQLFNTRYERALPTFITSNYRPSDAYQWSQKTSSRFQAKAWMASFDIGSNDLRQPRKIATLYPGVI